jgi:hypothetical protein
MGGVGPKGALGLEDNPPVVDSGTLALTPTPVPGPDGMETPVRFTRNTRLKRGGTTTPKGYVIVDNSLKDQLSDLTWMHVNTRINQLFRNAGGLQAVFVKTSSEVPQPNFTDGVVGCYLNSAQATGGFRNNVYNQLVLLGREISPLSDLAKVFNQTSHYKVDAGRSYTVKGIFNVPPYRPRIVCITYGVVSVDRAFAVWRGILVKKTQTTMSTIKDAPQKERISFGVTLGNLIAHELRHQLALSKTGVALGHTNSGLGADGAAFDNPNIKFSDEDVILANIAKLQRIQSEYSSNIL